MSEEKLYPILPKALVDEMPVNFLFPKIAYASEKNNPYSAFRTWPSDFHQTAHATCYHSPKVISKIMDIDNEVF